MNTGAGFIVLSFVAKGHHWVSPDGAERRDETGGTSHAEQERRIADKDERIVRGYAKQETSQQAGEYE